MSKNSFKKYENKKLVMFLAIVGIVLDLALDVLVFKLEKRKEA